MSTCNIFLSLTLMKYGRVDGEAKTLGFEGQIEIAGFGWGLGRPNSNADRASHGKAEKEFAATRQANQDMIDTGIDSKTGKELSGADRFKLIRAMTGKLLTPSSNQVTLKEFNFTKRFDVSSTAMLNGLNRQEEIKEACFTVLRLRQQSESGAPHSPFYVVKLKRARLASINLAVQSEGNAGWALVDTVVFKYQSVEVTHFPAPKEGAMTFVYHAPVSA